MKANFGDWAGVAPWRCPRLRVHPSTFTVQAPMTKPTKRHSHTLAIRLPPASPSRQEPINAVTADHSTANSTCFRMAWTPEHIYTSYTILYYTILYYTILYYTILYYTIPYHTTLYYIILSYLSIAGAQGWQPPGTGGSALPRCFVLGSEP